MAVTQSGNGKILVWEDFATFYDVNTSTSITTFVPGTGRFNLGNVTYCSVNEGSVGYTVDEANGIVSLTSDTGDDDSVWLLFAAKVIPNVNGPANTEARFKFDSASLSCIWAGFTSVLAMDTPVVPFELSVATMTYNGATAQSLGLVLDPDMTDPNDFRAAAGQNAAVTGTNLATNAALASTGVAANETITADEFYISRTEIDASGRAEMWLGHKGRGLDLIASLSGLVASTSLFAALGLENRSGAARILEVDYIGLEYTRDWEVT